MTKDQQRMSDPTESTFLEEGEERDQNWRPQTVALSKVRQEHNSTDESENESDEGIGEAFFSAKSNNTAKKKSPKQTDGKNGDSDSTAELKSDKQNSGLKQDEVAIMNQNVAKSSNSQLRPKTVTTKRSDERKQQLLDMGAVSIKDAVVSISDADVAQYTQTKSSHSPKPKADNCYICGKEFLLSSLKIHEKQCAKRFQRENEKPNTKDMQIGRATPSSEKAKGRLNYTGKSPASTNSPVSKIPRKLKLEACYLCGREFFAHSLGVHETQCIKNWKASKTPEAPPGKVTVQTTSNQCVHCEEDIAPGMEVFHKQQQCVMEKQKEGPESGQPERGRLNKVKGSPKLEKNMGTEKTGVSRAQGLKTTPCYMCGVQFLPHSLKVHEKKCRGRKQSKGDVHEKLKSSTDPDSHLLSSDISTPPISTPPALEHNAQRADMNQEGVEKHNQSLTETGKGIDTPSESSRHRTPKRPRTVLCYICGQEFLKSSLAVHEKQCANKVKPTQQAETEQGDDKKTQTAPGTGRKPEASGDLQKEGAPSPRKPKTQRCFVCGKEMLLSSLKIHEQQCQKKAEILKNINQQKGKSKPQQKGARQGGAMPKTQVCYVCGGAYLASSIKVHEAQCEKRWNTKTKTKRTK